MANCLTKVYFETYKRVSFTPGFSSEYPNTLCNKMKPIKKPTKINKGSPEKNTNAQATSTAQRNVTPERVQHATSTAQRNITPERVQHISEKYKNIRIPHRFQTVSKEREEDKQNINERSNDDDDDVLSGQYLTFIINRIRYNLMIFVYIFI
jgi:hypothetical protein